MAYDCRYAALVILIDLIDNPEGEFPATPECTQPAVFSTVVVREHFGEPFPHRTRTCVAHDAAFRLDTGYQDSIRLPAPPSSP